VLAGVVLAALVAPLAVAGTGDTLREGVRNGTTARETEIVGDIARSTGPKGGYVTRQSNVSTGAEAGGAAIYGCRTPLTSTESCLRASNRAGGRAFEFATLGELAGRIEVGGGGDGAKPFTTNATGVATGLNADRVDGLEAAELRGGPGPAGPTGSPGPAGPTGPAGPAGSDAGFAGAAAGGDLTGTYPDPQIGPNAVGAAEVNSSQVQRRVTPGCDANESIQAITTSGAPTCAFDEVSGWTMVTSSGPFNADDQKLWRSDCPAGTRVLGGGGFASSTSSASGEVVFATTNVAIVASHPGSATNWSVQADRMEDAGTSSWRLETYAICGRASTG
jgi:hypothetical protein